MKTFQTLVKESSISPDNLEAGNKFLNNIENMFRKQFPNGYFSGNVSKGFAGLSISFRFGLGYQLNNIIENDPLLHKVLIFVNNDDITTADNMEMRFSGLMYVKPLPNTHYAMSTIKTGTSDMKKGASIEKIEKRFKGWFPKLRNIFDENKGNLLDLDKIPAELLK